MPTPVKYGKIYMKDASGNLVQVMPEASSKASTYQGATTSASGVAGLVPSASIDQKDKFLKGDGTWEEVRTTKEVAVVSAVPTSSNTSNLDNESFIFYADANPSGSYAIPVTTTGNQTINGIKSFMDGLSGNLNGTATKAIQDVDGNAIKTTYAKISYVDDKFYDYPELIYASSLPTSSVLDDVANNSIIFCETENSSVYNLESVYTTENQTINGIKKFSAGVYSGVQTLESDESTINCSQANCFIKSISADTTFSFANVPSEVAFRITIVLTNAGSFNVSWPSSVKWSNNASPSLTANGTDILSFFTCNGGATWYGNLDCTGVTE